MAEVTALAGWFGGNRMLAHHVGDALGKLTWCGVPFAGGMSELPHIKARTILVNDLHRHVINLARVIANNDLCVDLIMSLEAKAFHPDELRDMQRYCQEVCPQGKPDLVAATSYFVCCWMGRASKAGGKDEFNGRPAIRWNADGGDSVVRYHSAIRMLETFSKTLKRCTFETMDAFDFLTRCEDSQGHGIYCDPPFPGVGRKYKHNAGQTDEEEVVWHTRLRDALCRFKATRVVCRFYEHPLIARLYQGWHKLEFKGRKQSNEEGQEILLLNQEPQQVLSF